MGNVYTFELSFLRRSARLNDARSSLFINHFEHDCNKRPKVNRPNMESYEGEGLSSHRLFMSDLEIYRKKKARKNKAHRGSKNLRLRPLSSVENPSTSFDSPSLSPGIKRLDAVKLQRARDVMPLQQSPKAKLMTKIDLHAMDIDRINDFDMFPELEVLDLSCNSISKIENLDNSRILQELKLYGNKITVVENLTRLKELRYLQLQYNEIRTLGDGLRLRNMFSLRLDHNNLTEIKCVQLCGCPNLRILNVSNNSLTDLQVLKVLPQLEELLAANNNLNEPPDLTTCPNLKEVDLSANQLTTLNGLHFVKDLEILNLSDNKLATLDFMGRQSHLSELLVSRNVLQDISSLREQFPNLEVLHLGSNRVDSWTSLMQLKDLPNLAELELKGNPFVNSYKSYHMNLIHDLPNLELLDGLKVKQNKSSGTPASDIRQKSAAAGSRVIEDESQFLKLVNDDDIFNTVTDRFGEVRNSVSQSLSVAEDKDISEEGSQQKLRGSRVRIKEAQKFAATHFPSELSENMAASSLEIRLNEDADTKEEEEDVCS